MLGRTEFPRIGEQPYFLTLAPVRLLLVPAPGGGDADDGADRRRRPRNRSPCPRSSPASCGTRCSTAACARSSSGTRSCRSSSGSAGSAARRAGSLRARFVDWATLRGGAHPAFLTIVEAEYRDGGRERYVLPLAMSSDREAARSKSSIPGALLARITGARKGVLYDGLFDDGTCATLLAAMQEERTVPMRYGSYRPPTSI